MERRQVLKGGAALFAAGAGGLSGCAGLGGGSDGSSAVSTDRIETWLPDPRAIDSDLDRYQFNAIAPASLSETIDANAIRSFNQDTTPQSETDPEVNVGTIAAPDVDLRVGASMSADDDSYGLTAYFGSFDADWLETKVQNNGYDRLRGVGDFTLYEDGDNGAGSRVTAISEEVLIAGAQQTSSGSDVDAVPMVETIIDTGQGEADGYVDQVEDMSEVLSALPDAHRFSGGTVTRGEETNAAAGEFTNLVAEGQARRSDGAETEVTEVLVFLDAVDVIDRDIETYIEQNMMFDSFSERPEYSSDGRVVTIEGRSA
jgi:hypothetical protein